MTNYCIVEDVKQIAGSIAFKDVGLTNEDEYTDYVDLVIEGASRQVDRYCNRPQDFFQNGGVTITEYYNGKGSSPPSDRLQYAERYDAWNEDARMFRLKHKPIVSITTFSELVNGTWTPRTKGDSSSADFREIDGVIRCTNNIPKQAWGNVQVVYKAGYTTCPRDIVMATAMLCANYIQQKAQDRTVAIFKFRRPQSMEFDESVILTADIKMILNKYRRMLFGSA